VQVLHKIVQEDLDYHVSDNIQTYFKENQESYFSCRKSNLSLT